MAQITRSIKLEPENWEVIAMIAQQHGVTVNALITTILKEYVTSQSYQWKPSQQWGGRRTKKVNSLRG